MTIAPDMLAYNLAIQLDVVADELRKLDMIPVRQAETLLALVSTARESAARVSDQTDPCAPDYAGPPLYAPEAPAKRRQPSPVTEPGSNVIRLFPAKSVAPVGE